MASLPETLSPDDDGTLARVCPFSQVCHSEDQLASALYANTCKYDRSVGYYSAVYAGHAKTDAYRSSGSSGGITSWLLAELLRLGEIDAVLHVVSAPPYEENNLLFKYGISTDVEAIRRNAKSRYYPI